MTKLISIFFTIFLACTNAIFAMPIVETPMPDLPEQFFVTERWLSWTTTFDIETKSFRLGTVHRKFLSLVPEYEFYDFQERLLAKARMRFFSLGAIFDVTDHLGLPMGRVEERIFSFFPKFDIISPDGQILAQAEMNFWGTKYTISTLSHKEIATLSRSFFRIKDNWTVTIYKREAFIDSFIDPRLFIVVMAFQTDMDNWRAANSLAMSTKMGVCNDFVKQNKIENPDESLEQLDETLMEYRDQFCDFCDPLEEDFDEVEKIADAYLRQYCDDFQDQSLDERKRLLKGCQLLMPLLEQGTLTSSQKNALFLMIEKQKSKVDSAKTKIIY